MDSNKPLQIDIVGNRYHLDERQENLIPLDSKLPIIYTGDLEVAMDHECERYGYYDLLSNCLYHPPENLKQLPGHVIGFSIPSYQYISEARNTPLVVYAETAELFDTDLARVVAENRIKEVQKPADSKTNQEQKNHQRKAVKRSR